MKSVWIKKTWYTYGLAAFVFIIILFYSLQHLSLLKEEWLQEKPCLTRTVVDLTDMVNNFEDIWNTTQTRCVNRGSVMASMFKIDLTMGSQQISVEMEEEVKNWLGQDDELFQKFFDQTLIIVENRWLDTTTVRNPLRLEKPKLVQDLKLDSLQAAQKLIDDTMEYCSFCTHRYQDHTATDTFGRIQDFSDVRSASNAFRLGEFHGLVFPLSHDPLNISFETFKHWFQSAKLWFDKVNSISPGHTHPMVLWDSMPQAGASQVHPHIHTLMGNGNYMGKFLHMNRAAQQYFEDTNGRNYINDYVDVHLALGLAIRLGKAVVVSPLDSWKEHEFIIIGPEVDEDWLELLYDIYRIYIEDMDIYCWSSGMAWPAIGGDFESRLGAVARISSRGDCQSQVNDVSSLDLYTFFNVNTDPYRSLRYVERRLMKKNDFARTRLKMMNWELA